MARITFAQLAGWHCPALMLLTSLGHWTQFAFISPYLARASPSIFSHPYCAQRRGVILHRATPLLFLPISLFALSLPRNVPSIVAFLVGHRFAILCSRALLCLHSLSLCALSK